MEFLETKYKRYGLLGTILFHGVLLFLFIFYGLTVPVPIPEETIMINFGTSDQGSGNIQPEEVSASQLPTTTSDANTDVETQNTTDAVNIKKKETAEKVPDPIKDPEKVVNKEALYTGKKTTNTNNKNEGETGNPGDQGNPDGSKESNSHIGDPNGKGTSYSLGNRKALVKTRPRYDCQETGTVVVKITVDRNGNVVKVSSGERGTTNTAACLMQKAEEAAFKTKWEADPNAPELQVGKITYNFVLN